MAEGIATPASIAMSSRFTLGDRVYWFNNSEKCGTVISVRLYPGEVKYDVSWSPTEGGVYYDFELSVEKPVVSAVS